MEKGSTKKQNTKVQHSQEVLNEEELVGQFKTVREETTELAIGDIVPFQMIPEYRSPTESLYPIVVKTPKSYQCIDGWDIINKAKANGDSIVRCSISKVENHSDIELAIRKVSIRTKPQGGRCTYPETLRNTSLLAQIIISETENPIIYSHGGARRGNDFTLNREDDLRDILSERIGQERTTINTYLNQSRYINNDTFNALIDADVGRNFFEACRVSKRNLIRDMESDEVDETKKSEVISLKMLEWLDEFLKTGKVRTDFGEEEQEADAEDNSDDNDSTVSRPRAEVDFEHQARVNQNG